MKLSAFWKGLIMALIGFIATMLSDLESFNVWYVVIATVAFILIYVAKNAVYPSTSQIGLNIRDLISGLMIAVGMAISSFAASIITLGSVDWHALWLAVVGAVVGYFVKTVPSKA
jgi:uncharacterized membrane protein YvlD (DUF360 family)